MRNTATNTGRLVAVMATIFFLVALGTGTALAASKKPIVFADLGWDSVQVHNRVAGFIIEHGLGYKVKYTQGETILLNTALINAKGADAPNVNMETWTENWQELYDKGIAQGKDPGTNKGFIRLGPNFPNSVQGWYVPTYMIKGDKKRGIKATAPGLKSVYDMPKYWKLFKDPEDPKKGRFYSCIPGWSCKTVNDKKFDAYGIRDYYNIMEPGSGAALAGSMEAAYKRGKPWIGYYWAPTWVLGKLDMTRLEEPPYDEAVFKSTGKSAYPAVKCDIIVHKKLPEWAPDVVAFLKNYRTTLDINNKFLAHMRETGGKPNDGARWFLTNYANLWTKWVPADVAAKVKAAMK
jgi:glycine betaine/proline transport system substrate-binding protein